ncbi:MAG: hypothetical protein ACK4OI_06690, partial [Rhizobium oryzihabitans]
MKQAGFMRFSMGAAQMETALILAPHIYPDVFRIDRCHRKSCQALDGVLLRKANVFRRFWRRVCASASGLRPQRPSVRAV